MVNETFEFIGLSGMMDPLIRTLTLVVEFAATYLVHSTLFLSAAWFILIARPARLKTGDVLRPSLIEAGWKLAAILPMITTAICLSADLSPSYLRWSYTLAESRSKDTLGMDPVTSPPVIERVPSVDVLRDSITVAAPEPSSERPIVLERGLSALAQEPLPSDSLVARWEPDVEKTLDHITSGQIISSDPIEPTSVRSTDLIREQPRPSVAVAGLGAVVVAWVAFCLVRLLRQRLKLTSILGRCLPFETPLRHELDRFVPGGSRIRLLRLVDAADSPSRGNVPVGLPISNHQKPCSQPFACGILNWTIVVPQGIEERLSPDELRALLAHEVAHLVRRDPVWQWIGEILCTCLAFQPLNFLARRRWQWAIELLCDDWAVDRHIPSTLLATCLAKVAEWRLEQLAGSRWQSGLGVSAVGPDGSLTCRIHWLLRSQRNVPASRPLVGKVFRTAAVTTGLVLGACGPRFVFDASVQAARMDDQGSIVEPPRDVLEREVQQTLEELQRLQIQLERLNDPEVSAVADGVIQRFSKLASQRVPAE